MDTTLKTASVPNPIKVDHNTLDAVSNGTFYNPHSVLGVHLNQVQGSTSSHTSQAAQYATIRVLKPLASHVEILIGKKQFSTHHEWNGIFVTVVPVAVNKSGTAVIPDYRIQTTYDDETVLIQDDPYRFLPTLGSTDTYLISEGRHERLWEVLGAHLRHFSDPMGTPAKPNSTSLSGVSFAVWAPSAHAVRVVGDFNGWNGRQYAMRSMGESGVWEIFIPELSSGEKYKYQILNAQNEWKEKADPLEFYHQIPPENASIVFDSHYEWDDATWMNHRLHTNPHEQAMSIYEVHAGSWKHGETYRELADNLVSYVVSQHFTHVEFMPLTQYPFTGSWGYQVTGYYAPDSRGGNPDDFKYMVDAFHKAGIGVILDWVPAHFPKDDFALGRFDGTPLYEDPDPLRGEHPDWGTYIFNFGRREVRNFLVANAVYWLKEFHIDGLRVDAVASMLYLDYSRKPGHWRPNKYGGNENIEAIAFLKEANATAYRNNPGCIMIAEESTSWPGVTAPTSQNGLGFGLKWNMGWMHDTLSYMQEDPINRQYHHNEITFSMVYAYSEHFVLPLSHDEVVYGKGSIIGRMHGTDAARFAQVRELYAYQWAHPGRKMIFMGDEIAQDSEWDATKSIDWQALKSADHKGVQTLIADLNHFYTATPALWEDDFSPSGFQWLTSDDASHNTLSFMRLDTKGEPVVVIINFSGATWTDYQIPLPNGGKWYEALTTDDEKYNGSGIHNGTFKAMHEEYHSREWSAKLTIPAFSAVFLKPELPVNII